MKVTRVSGKKLRCQAPTCCCYADVEYLVGGMYYCTTHLPRKVPLGGPPPSAVAPKCLTGGRKANCTHDPRRKI